MKKGYTLIEILMVLLLVTTVFSGGTFIYKSTIRLKENLDLNFYTNYVSTFINSCKNYCRDNEIEGIITTFECERGFIFIVNRKIVYRLILPQNIKVNGINTKNEKIDIDRRGFTTSGCSIKLCNPYKIRNITIYVATGYVDVKDEWKEN